MGNPAVTRRYRKRRPNPAHNPLRQRVAPQPDRDGYRGERPMDQYRRNVPGAVPGVRMGGMIQAPRRPQMPGSRQAAQRKGMQPRYGPANQDYRNTLDWMTPNGLGDATGGLNDAQVRWIKQNLLNRPAGARTGREGQLFQNQLNRYIQGIGGQENFQRMLAGMPGFTTASVGQHPNRFDVARPSRGPAPGRIQRTMAPGAAQRSPMAQQAFDRQAAMNQANWQFPSTDPRYAGQPGYTGPTPAQTGPVAPQRMQQRGVSPQQGIAPQTSPTRQTYQQTNQQAGITRPSGPNAPRGEWQAPTRTPPRDAAGRPRSSPRGTGADQNQRARDRKFFIGKGIPMTPEFEEGMRQLTDEFEALLAELGVAEQDIMAMTELTKRRLAENHGTENAALQEEMTARGLQGGAALENASQMGLQHGRAFEDLGLQTTKDLRSIAQQRAEAVLGHQKARQELFMQAARDAVANPNVMSGVNKTARRRGKKSKSSRRRSG